MSGGHATLYSFLSEAPVPVFIGRTLQSVQEQVHALN